MAIETLLRIEIDIFSLAILAIIGTTILLRSRDHRFMDSSLFLLLILSIGLVIVFEGASWVVDGKPGASMRIAGYAINAIFYALIFIPMGIYLVYVDHFTEPDKPVTRSAYYWIALSIATLGALSVFVSLPYGLLFSLDAHNVYARGPLNGLFNTLMAVMGLLPAYVLTKRRKAIPLSSFSNLMFYPVMPIIGGVLQNFIYGTNLFWPATVISVFITFVNVQNRQIDSDYLTGAFNRSSLQEYLATLVRKVNSRRTFAGIMIDLDHFKRINDTFGHLAGDQALIETCRILHDSVRKSDFVARFGGDEFIVILDTGNEDELKLIASRIVANMEAANSPERPFALLASMGKAVFDLERDGNLDIFLHRLDRLMYEDKARSGRND